jgi:predicted GNAT superfamily acetyltransferase
VTVRPLESPEELRACVALQEQTWGASFSERVPYAVLWFARRIGGVLLGAFDGDELAGFVFGITGWVAGRPVHWSDMLAVRADARNRGVGIALKRAQRAALLAAGVDVAHWTFDPLESRNAHVNFNRLGTVSREYVRDVYGASDSPLHQGIGTDRLVVAWHLSSARVAERVTPAAGGAARTDHTVATAALSAAAVGAPLVNAVRMQAGMPACAPPDLTLDTPEVRIAIPADVQAVKQSAPALAAEWRACTRAAFEEYFARGYTATALLRVDEQVSAYVLECAAGPDAS